jgi:Mg2+ and Co2+ transporter CorA
VIVTVAICVDGGRGPSLPPAGLYDARQDRGGFTWVGLYEPSEVVFTCVTSGFDPHMLAVKDASKAHQRPKVDRKDDSVFVVLKWVRYAEGSRLLSTGPATVLYAIMEQYDQVKEISAWTATLAVPTIFTSIYAACTSLTCRIRPGRKGGYPLLLVLIVLITALLYRSLKRVGWH